MSNSSRKQGNQSEPSSLEDKSGSQYHEEHAGNVTGYGEIDPNAEGLRNKQDNPASS